MPINRTETDSLGSRELPDSCLYGVSTLRAIENFSVSSRVIGDEPEFIRALAQIKAAAAAANRDLQVYDSAVAEAIIHAADEVIGGSHADAFPVDMMEGSGGTSINMNMNEVLANRALDLLSKPRGRYDLVSPNDHVNNGQSTNDVVPAAVKLAIHQKAATLLDVLDELAGVLRRKAAEFDDVLRVGRTCMQAAQPMRLGQAFGGYASAIERQRANLGHICDELLILPLGGTAIGTGLGAAPGYRPAFYGHLQRIVGKAVRPADDMFDAMQNADAFSRISAEIRVTAEITGKIATDLILLSSSASSATGEIQLPAVQPGSSIMPGKINPVIPILMQQAVFGIVGNDSSVSIASLSGQLEINHFEPIIATRLFDSIDLLTKSARIFAQSCISGIEANREQSLDNLLASSAIATVFVPRLGYARTSELVQLSLKEQRPLVALAIEQGLLDQQDIMATLRESTIRKDSPEAETPSPARLSELAGQASSSDQ